MEWYIFVTKDCNLTCSYCSIPGIRKGYMGGPVSKPTYGVSDLINCILRDRKNREQRIHELHVENEYEKKGIIEDTIVFYGGEPLLNQEFIKEFIQKSKERLDDLTYVLQTNGTFLDETDPYILENLDLIMVSVDGTKEIHDRHRKFPDGRGSYDIIMKNVKWLRSLRDGVTINEERRIDKKS